MSIDKVKSIKVFPGIGMARVGNSSQYFIGPEAPGIIPDPGDGKYKDADGKIKPQAARYRVYGYDEDGNVVMEITADSNISIEWEVHMTNKKAANYAFQGKFGFNPKQLRNPGVQAKLHPDQRNKLIIDPGPKTISGISLGLHNGTEVGLDGGTIFDGIGQAEVPTSLLQPGKPGKTMVTYHPKAVSLGRLETDDKGRLIIVPGEGKGESQTTPPITIVKGAAKIEGQNGPNMDPTSNGNSYFNNPGWYDDTGGGSVNAKVTVNGGATFSTNDDPDKRGWIGVAPPNYGPSLYNVVSLLDLQINIFPQIDPNAGTLYYAVTGINVNEDFLASSKTGSGFVFKNVTGATVKGARPALAAFNGDLYYAVIGSGSDNNYIGVLSEDGTSVSYTIIGSTPSNVGPALAVYNNQLYYAITGKDGNVYIASSSDGKTFSTFEKVGNQASNVSPALAAYNGDLYLAVTGKDNLLYLGTKAKKYQLEAIGGPARTALAPSIAAFDGQLYYAVTGLAQKCYLAAWNNNDVNKDFDFTFQQVGDTARTALPPAITAFNGKLYYAVTGLAQKTYLASAGPGSFDFSFQRSGRVSLSNAGPALATRETVSFYRDIYPILRTVVDYAWVNQPAFNGHGPGSNGDFLRQPFLDMLANPDDKGYQARTFVFRFIRPAETLTDAPPPPAKLPNKTYDGGVQRGSLMPHLFGEGGSPTENNFNKTNFPNQWLSLTRHQLAKFQKWVNGDFETGQIVNPVPLDQIPLEDQPMAISFAALQPTVGGGFHPGIELTYNMKFREYFAAPFRFAKEIVYNGEVLAQITPGSVAAYMSIPWHGDFWSCNISWWAAMRPDIVVQVKQPVSDPPILIPIDWFRGPAVGIPPNADNTPSYLSLPNQYGTTGYEDMARYWCKFGFVVPSGESDLGEEGFKEVERDPCLDDTSNPCGKCDPNSNT